jgi:hypothetical protein
MADLDRFAEIDRVINVMRPCPEVARQLLGKEWSG